MGQLSTEAQIAAGSQVKEQNDFQAGLELVVDSLWTVPCLTGDRWSLQLPPSQATAS